MPLVILFLALALGACSIASGLHEWSVDRDTYDGKTIPETEGDDE